MNRQTKKQKAFEQVAVAFAAVIPHDKNRDDAVGEFAKLAGLLSVPVAKKKLRKKEAWRQVAIALAEAYKVPGLSHDEWNVLGDQVEETCMALAPIVGSYKYDLLRLEGLAALAVPKKRKA